MFLLGLTGFRNYKGPRRHPFAIFSPLLSAGSSTCNRYFLACCRGRQYGPQTPPCMGMPRRDWRFLMSWMFCAISATGRGYQCYMQDRRSQVTSKQMVASLPTEAIERQICATIQLLTAPSAMTALRVDDLPPSLKEHANDRNEIAIFEQWRHDGPSSVHPALTGYETYYDLQRSSFVARQPYQ